MASTKFLDPPPAAARDKASFVLADLARHIMNAEFLQNPKLDQDAFMERMLEGFQAEIDSPTDEPEGEITQ
jgi:hypothetical protein